MSGLRRLWFDDEGATAVEYGLILAAIAGVILVVIFVVGKKVKNVFNNVGTAL